jgi:hypothetical protein
LRKTVRGSSTKGIKYVILATDDEYSDYGAAQCASERAAHPQVQQIVQ